MLVFVFIVFASGLFGAAYFARRARPAVRRR